MIEVILSRNVISIVSQKYTSLRRQLLRSGHRNYSNDKLRNNISTAISINGDYIEPTLIRNPIIQEWKAKGYRVIPFKHWFYAVQLRRMPNGETAAVAVDARYEGDYHDDTMQTKPYNESIIRIKESQLMNIIKESIKRILNII